ncbi:hypothetical protein [Chryseobacterium sp. X308]|uniref:hypothetical protein n=1 Tax=Chryseobacterium sp. X308 TaxID=2884873 RepID=UPI001D13A126|nr:hypothetical protein [Chryseobacterium sp. X308]
MTNSNFQLPSSLPHSIFLNGFFVLKIIFTMNSNFHLPAPIFLASFHFPQRILRSENYFYDK